jgi:pimeloyl-ACP methyl ester carboxylesterase
MVRNIQGDQWGERMDKVTFSSSRDKSLSGHLYRVDSDAIIIMAHGFTSDKISKGRFKILAKAFNRSGYNALAFDFSGIGESEDDSLTAAKQMDDLQAAISYAKSRGYRRIALYGHSLGSLICLMAYSQDIVTMVLSGALTGPMHYNWHDYFTDKQMAELEEKGYLTIVKEDSFRKKIVVDEQMLRDFEEIDQETIMKEVKCPVLLIHGNNEEDEEELLLLENSKLAMKYLSNGSRLEIIEGATHSFMEHMDILKELAVDWYEKHLR